MLDFKYWILDFSNEFFKKIINSDFNFDEKRKEESIHLGYVWKIENFYCLKMLQIK